MKKVLILLLGAVIVGVSFLLVISKKDVTTERKIKIGAVLPLTGGGLSPYGQSAQNAILLAIEKSGVKDKVELVVEDDKGCQAKEAATAAQKLIDVDHVVAIVGPMCTSPALAIAPIAEAKKIVVLTSASGKTVTQSGDFIFRTYMSDATKNIALATYVYAKGYRKAAFIHDASQVGSVSQRDDTKEEFIRLGGTVVADESFVAKDKDLRTQLQKIKNSKPDIIFIGGLPDELVLILKQVQELHITSPVASTEASIDPSLLRLAGTAGEGLLIPADVSPTNMEVSTFVANYKAKYSAEPKLFSAETYDATLLAIRAAMASDGSGESIKANLEKLGQKYIGASGEISFDKNGDVKKPVIIKQVINGKLVEVK
jgi:branched-chain amino acid transport system substrate-binding protein